MRFLIVRSFVRSFVCLFVWFAVCGRCLVRRVFMEVSLVIFFHACVGACPGRVLFNLVCCQSTMVVRFQDG